MRGRKQDQQYKGKAGMETETVGIDPTREIATSQKFAGGSFRIIDASL